MSAQKIQSLVEAALPGATVEAEDTTGTHDHFQVLVISPSFEGKGMIERHRMVYAILGSAVGGAIHALSLRTLTPAETQKKS
ncbi:MAG: BolA family protein [Deltaproteobacteria bacterium]